MLILGDKEVESGTVNVAYPHGRKKLRKYEPWRLYRVLDKAIEKKRSAKFVTE